MKEVLLARHVYWLDKQHYGLKQLYCSELTKPGTHEQPEVMGQFEMEGMSGVAHSRLRRYFGDFWRCLLTGMGLDNGL